MGLETGPLASSHKNIKRFSFGGGECETMKKSLFPDANMQIKTSVWSLVINFTTLKEETSLKGVGLVKRGDH